MSFDIILLDGNALGLSRQASTNSDLIKAANSADTIFEGRKLELSTDMQHVLNELIDKYGTLRDPIPGCPWTMWPPISDRFGHKLTFGIGSSIADEVVKIFESICSKTSVFVLNPQMHDKSWPNLEHEKDRLVGIHPETGVSVYVKQGQWSVYFQYGGNEEVESLKTRGLLKDMDIDTVTLADATRLEQLPRVLGKSPNGDDIVVNFGVRGAYVKYESKFHLLGELDPFTITLDEVMEIVHQ